MKPCSFLVLAYLPLVELLSMNQACKSLKHALDIDILPWLNLFAENPLNSRVSDYLLMDIVSKANGRLKTLGLIDCLKITDDGLQAVIASNPLINKLYIPGCTSLTPEGVIRAVEMLSEHSRKPICLKINGIYDINKEHLGRLRSLIQVNQMQRKQLCNFYHNKNKHFISLRQEDETNPVIDIDICPKCSEVRMVFDCPWQTCTRKRKKQLTECCGCCLCIPRCEECGRCADAVEQDDSEAACAGTSCAQNVGFSYQNVIFVTSLIVTNTLIGSAVIQAFMGLYVMFVIQSSWKPQITEVTYSKRQRKVPRHVCSLFHN